VKIIQEVSLEILLNGKPLANIACAGNYLEELAAGFLKSEKIIGSREQILKIEVNNDARRVKVILKEDKKYNATNITNIASSGARGQAHVNSLLPLTVPDPFRIKSGVALKLMKDLLDGTQIHKETHGTHCSALAREDKIFVLREDIGRHNTIDMLAGYCLLREINIDDSILLTTGRISSEIVYKAWNMGVPAIISHSAPTLRAVELLRNANITSIGYVRGGKMNIYSQERRVII
jgi:FdhD protein